uniref:Molecular chaperone DnaK (HSP70) n=1 Tax=Candidatus Kentrum sp. DK TaxID=2126562 RepID=A0A450SVV1_9GAMM|nr:MAG: hypothetical protein BECKDK2373B_GA0170837_107110 [Candidatus Kentron sp. DK]
MKYYGIDFGNANTSVALLDTDRLKPFQPDVLPHSEIGFHYLPAEAPTLIPSRIHDDRIGRVAALGSGTHTHLKAQLAAETPGPETIELCGAYFKALLQAFGITFTEQDKVVFTLPSFEEGEIRDRYYKHFTDALRRAIDNFDALNAAKVFDFCDEALASAVGYRVFQGDRAEQKSILCLDVGSFSADATYFETRNFHDVQRNDPLDLRHNAIATTSGSRINAWIQEYFRENKQDLDEARCEALKIALSQGEGILSDQFPEAVQKRINQAQLNEILESRHFYAELATLCADVLPESVREKDYFLDSLDFVFTGGTVNLPFFAESLYRALRDVLLGGNQDGIDPEVRIKLAQAAYKPFSACVTGAVWWRWLKSENRRFIPGADSDYALQVFSRDKAGKLRKKPLRFLRGGEIPQGGRRYKLLPAREGETEYRIEIAKADQAGKWVPAGYLQGPLSSDGEILLDCTLEQGRPVFRVNGEETGFVCR